MGATSTGGGDSQRVGVDLPHEEGNAGGIGLANNGGEGWMRESECREGVSRHGVGTRGNDNMDCQK